MLANALKHFQFFLKNRGKNRVEFFKKSRQKTRRHFWRDFSIFREKSRRAIYKIYIDQLLWLKQH